MKLLKIVVFAAVATAQLAGGQAPAAGVVDEEAERGKYSGAKDPFVCGSVKATGKGPLKFNCKMGKKGQTCKVKCNKAPKNIHTPKKMSCVKNQWSDKKGKTQFDINDFGCLDKEPKNPYGDNGKTTTKPYKTTTKPYKTTTKPKTTKKPYKTTTKPYKTTQKPKTTKYPSGKKPDQYKPVIGCPWEKKGSSVIGDCGEKFKGRCNLKYFKVCGQSFFNSVYDDVCRWQDALQLIPMVTDKLVPLGNQFEKANNVKCNGKNPYGKSNEELFDGEFEEARDIPLCDADAGAVPCDLVDFSDVTTAREFHHKIEKLYHDYLFDHCNAEWHVHFEALLVRMRNSLFCADGSSSDHDDYQVTSPPPTYKPTKKPTQAPYKTTKKPTQAPYKTTKKPTQKPYNQTEKPTQKPYNPTEKPTQKPYDDDNKKDKKDKKKDKKNKY